MKITQAKRLAAVAYIVRGIEWGLIAAQRAKERATLVASAEAERLAWRFQGDAFRSAGTCLGGMPLDVPAAFLSTTEALRVISDLAEPGISSPGMLEIRRRLQAAALSAEDSARRA